MASQDVDVEPGLALPSFQVDRAVLNSQKRFLFWECSWGSNMFLPCYKIHLLWHSFGLIDWHNRLLKRAPAKKLSGGVGTVFLMILKKDSLSKKQIPFVVCSQYHHQRPGFTFDAKDSSDALGITTLVKRWLGCQSSVPAIEPHPANCQR